MGTQNKQTVQAVDTSLEILETLHAREVAGVTELATALDMSKANVHKHLATLREHGLVVRDGERYRPSLRLFEMGSTVRSRHPLYREAASNVQELAEVTNQTATLLVPAGKTGIYVRSLDPDDQSTPGFVEGMRRPLYETAAGQAVLACLDDEERVDRLPETLDRENRTILADNLDRVEDSGIAVEELPGEPDVQEVAAPVTVRGDPVGAIGVLVDGVQSRDRVEPSYSQLVKKAGTALSKRMYLRRDADSK